MKRVLIFIASALMFINGAGAAVRDGGVASRAKNGTGANSSQRLANSSKQSRSAARTSVLAPRALGTAKATVSRSGNSRATTARSATQSSAPRVVSRATTAEASDLAQTRTGAEYERCKTAYFTCMDQFCGQKNDDYRRCSCSNRIYDMADARETLTKAGEQLTIFTENLDAVGMTAAQAMAMKSESDGESAFSADKSASKALLQAILNSIRGQNASVGGSLSDLNSINISFDTSNAFGTMDSGQAIAKYDGQNLYSAVYPQCRAAVRADCNDASLQRAITAYLMAIEQDCNTVQTAIENKRKEMKSAVREGSAMLDLARVENRQKHNSDDIATCVANVESAILSEQVCGAGYHKCLDNGEFIDITTGAPIAGVTNFYKLAEMLTFADGVDAASQKLSKNNANRTFVNNFEKRTKMFAADALDKCVENADIVWAEYLDKALLDIYYAQRAKVDVIKQGCFDFVSSCYMNGDKSMTAAMQELTGTSSLILQPSKLALTGAMCTDYVNSCNALFDGNVIKDYIEMRQDTDTLSACRAIAKQCFDSYGGTNYENFYYPYSGLFDPNKGNAPDWFSLYEYVETAAGGVGCVKQDGDIYRCYKSPCAQQLTTVAACSDKEMIEQVFGGFDVVLAVDKDTVEDEYKENLACDSYDSYDSYVMTIGQGEPKYGIFDKVDYGTCISSQRQLRPTGVATEVYNQVVDILTTQCSNLQGRFMEIQFSALNAYKAEDRCKIAWEDKGEHERIYPVDGENMCPRDYKLSVDTLSWGVCSCWENGGRRSKDGKSAKCMTVIPLKAGMNDLQCEKTIINDSAVAVPTDLETLIKDESAWCTRYITSSQNQVCPLYKKSSETSSETPSETSGETSSNYIKNTDDCDAEIDSGNYPYLPQGLM